MRKYAMLVLVFLVVFINGCGNNQTTKNNPSDMNNSSKPTVKYKKYDYRVTANYIKPEVLVNYNKAIEVNPDNANLYSARAATKYLANDFKGTIEDCNKAIQLKADLPYSYYYRGLSKIKLGDNQGALQDLQKTKTLILQDGNNTFLNLLDQQIKELLPDK